MNIWGLLQVVLTAFEIGMSIWLCDALVYNGEIVKDNKGYLAGSILLLTVLTIGNRQDIFFSWIFFLLQIFYIWLTMIFIKRKNKAVCFITVFDCQLIVTLMDLVFSFFAVNYMNDKFWENMYYGIGIERIIVYLLSRSMLSGMCLVFHICKKKYHFMIENYKGVMFSVGAVGTIWGWMLLKMLVEQGEDLGLKQSFQIMTCLLMLLVFMVIELRNTHIKASAKMVQMKNELLEQSYRDIQKLYINNQYIFHDFKNHMILLKNYLNKKEYDKVSIYLDKIVEPMEKLHSYSNTGCEVLVLVILIILKSHSPIEN